MLHISLKNLRKELLSLGTDIRFESRLTGLRTENGSLAGITVEGPECVYALPCRQLVLAVGHSARDTFEMLHGQHVFAEGGIALQNHLRLADRLFGCGVDGVSLLPQKLPVTQEGAGGPLPPQHAAPLVIKHRQVAPGVDDPAPVITEKCLGGGADAQLLLQLLAAAHESL